MSDQESTGFEPTEVLAPSRTIAGRYRVGRLLGEGAMGAVYEAEHIELGTRVAVKLLNERFMLNPVVAERARREARATAAIRHDNIVAVTDTGTEDGQPYLVMELLEGESLGAILRRERTLAEPVAAAVLVELLSGLAAAHEQGVIHRDLKPDNVFVATTQAGQPRVKILDFGISKLVGEGIDDLTRTGVALGTPHYMAPEQILRAKLDARIDVYAAGVILYRAVVGAVPFAGFRGEERDRAILQGKFPPPRQVRPDLSETLESIISKAMALDRDDRYPDATSFMDALLAAEPGAAHGLAGVMAGDAAATESQESARLTPNEPRQRSSRRWLIPVVALVPILAIALWKVGGTGSRGAIDAGTASTPVVESGEALRLGMATYASDEVQRRTYGPIAEHLSRRLGRPVRLELSRDPIELRRGIEEGELDLIALDPLTYVHTQREHPGLRLLATPITPGGTSFEVHIVARADAGIETLSDLEGRVFCYVPSAASGYFVPRVMLRRAGLDPDGTFDATRLVDDHLAALRYVDAGSCAATAVYASLLFEADEAGLSPYAFRILATSERIPNDAYTASPLLPVSVAEAVRDALLELEPGTPEAAEVLGTEGEIIGFAAADDGDYDRMRVAEAQERRATAGGE